MNLHSERRIGKRLGKAQGLAIVPVCGGTAVRAERSEDGVRLRKYVGGPGLSLDVTKCLEDGHRGRREGHRLLRVDRAVGNLASNEIEPTSLDALASLQHPFAGFNLRDGRIELAVIGESPRELSVEARLHFGLRRDLERLVHLNRESEKVSHPTACVAETLQQREPIPRRMGKADGIGKVVCTC